MVVGRTGGASDWGYAMTIPVMRPWLGQEEADAAAEAVRSGWVAQGPRVAAFEEAVAARLGGVCGVAVSSCTAALHLGLLLLGVGPGDEVVVPSLSFIATANVVVQAGATPVFADVHPHTLNLTPESIGVALSARTKAVIVVHQAGTPADLDAISALCVPRGVHILEDAACAMGSTYKGRSIGGTSHLAAFSFHPRKVITTGEGGILLINDTQMAERARRLREHGMSVSAANRHQSNRLVLETYDEVGFNYRMTDVQAAVGLVQLGRLDEILARRRVMAGAYRQMLADIPGIRMADDPPFGRSNFQSFWVSLPDDFPVSRNALLEHMMAQGISGRRGIMAAHLQPAYRERPTSTLPVTERATAQSLILPMFHQMTGGEQRHVVDVFRKEAGLSASL
ncbi:MAG: DegT/DnrJ/EryC1/StrS family aminotransferase [Acidimicrobiaceae bacterium]|nr:DegT/DnrJ/EryC1/StrS family aminotransferase [Acidimicrobiaceae bacterium]